MRWIIEDGSNGVKIVDTEYIWGNLSSIIVAIVVRNEREDSENPDIVPCILYDGRARYYHDMVMTFLEFKELHLAINP